MERLTQETWKFDGRRTSQNMVYIVATVSPTFENLAVISKEYYLMSVMYYL